MVYFCYKLVNVISYLSPSDAIKQRLLYLGFWKKKIVKNVSNLEEMIGDLT
jgi:hypothetical protein